MPRLTAALAEGGTPLVASITDSIDLTEPTFTGPRDISMSAVQGLYGEQKISM